MKNIEQLCLAIPGHLLFSVDCTHHHFSGLSRERRSNSHTADAEDFDQLGLRGARSGRGRGESLAALVALSQRVVLLSKASHFNGFRVNVE